MKIKLLFLFVLCLVTMGSCKRDVGKPERKASLSSIFKKKKLNDSLDYDLTSILKGGELIITTISSPETYYDYRGVGMGLQYALIENFADSQGLIVRVEVAADTTELIRILHDGEADVIAYPLDPELLTREGFIPAGYNKNGRWGVRKNAKLLADAIDDWYGDGVEIDVNKMLEEKTRRSHQIERRAHAAFLSRERGVISEYDNLFKDAAATTGWDWKLIAAMCYQESTFDPNARSYVGAQGLMQLMPRTAKSLGLAEEEICVPEKNVATAAKLIVQLDNQFSDIRSRDERQKFVLAAYNGGPGHVRDAISLAKKYGRNSQVWDEVAPYILGLSQPKYYKDNVVRYGYMIGKETANYVHKITERWYDYGGDVAVSPMPSLPTENAAPKTADKPAAEGAKSKPAPAPQRQESAKPGEPSRQQAPEPRPKKSRFSSGVQVIGPDDPRFHTAE